jgi:Icc-related predicted phosphoesterase
MKIVVISDTHGMHEQLDMSKYSGDVLIHCGDITTYGNTKEVKKFLRWFAQQDFDYKLFIAGNHDRCLEQDGLTKLILPIGVHYLQDKSVVINGVKFYGTPYQPEFNNWFFGLPRNSNELKNKWDLIPIDTDVLITHCPPSNTLDRVIQGENVGCELLQNRIIQLELKYHVFGHIHEGYGSTCMYGNQVCFVNASSCNFQYQVVNKPVEIIL